MTKLTIREEEVIRYLKQGKTNREIGQIMGVKEKTVKFYIMHINMKLKTKNRLEIVAVTSNGVVDIRLASLDSLNKNLEQLSNTILKQSTRISELESALLLHKTQTGELANKISKHSLPVGI